MDPIKLAKLMIFFAAGISFVVSAYLWFIGHRDEGLFVGLWVPSIICGGLLLLTKRSGGGP